MGTELKGNSRTVALQHTISAGFSLISNGNQATTTGTTVALNTWTDVVSTDLNNFATDFLTGTPLTTYTIVKNGFYYIGVGANFAAVNTTGIRAITVFKNGSPTHITVSAPGTADAAGNNIAVSGILRCVSTDALTVRVVQDSTANMNVSAAFWDMCPVDERPPVCAL